MLMLVWWFTECSLQSPATQLKSKQFRFLVIASSYISGVPAAAVHNTIVLKIQVRETLANKVFYLK